MEVEGSSSGLTFESMDKVDLNLFYYHGKRLVNVTEKPAPVGYKYRVLPEWIRNSKSIINIKNTDFGCFKWCVARSMFMEKHHNERLTTGLKNFAREIDWKGLDDPDTFNEENLCKFEDANNLRIIIFSIGDEPGYEVTHLRNDHMNPKYRKIYLGHYIDHFFLIVKLKDLFVVVMVIRLVKQDLFMFVKHVIPILRNPKR
jgi:hypothetical protein